LPLLWTISGRMPLPLCSPSRQQKSRATLGVARLEKGDWLAA